MDFRKLPLRNLVRKPVRAACLLLLVALLSFAVFGGTVLVRSLAQGLNSLEARLGADIIVVPAEAKSKTDLENMLLEGTPGQFYMDKSIENEVRAVPGVERASAQLYLTSAKSGCCSARVQIIGYDPKTDFTVGPWAAQVYDDTLDDGEVIVGADISPTADGTFLLYDQACRVVGQLDKTGTGLDTAVYCNTATLRLLMDAATAHGWAPAFDGVPEDVISAVYVDVAEGNSPQVVAGYINVHLRGVDAVAAKNMLSGVADSLGGLSRTIRLMVVAVWLVAFLLLLVAFSMLIGERAKEFAVLRVLGTSRGMLARMALKESLLLSVAGGLLGVILAALIIFPFHTAIEQRLGLPFLLPGLGTILLIAAGTLCITVLLGALASAVGAYRLSRVDAGNALRDGN